MKKYNEGFAHYQWNPVTGCTEGCSYCPARDLAKGFAGDVRANQSAFTGNVERWPAQSNAWTVRKPIENLNYPCGFDPTLHMYRFDNYTFPRTPSVIAVCPLTDLFSYGIPMGWKHEVVGEAVRHYEHIFLFHTHETANLINYTFARNCWVGTHISRMTDRTWCDEFNGAHAFAIFDPLTVEFDSKEKVLWRIKRAEWIVIGAIEKPGDVGLNRPDSIKAICEAADELGIPVWMMDSCRSMYSGELRQELPEAFKKCELSKARKDILIKKCGVCKAEMPAKEMLRLSRMTKQRDDRGTTFCYLCPDCEEKVLKLVNGDAPIWR